MPITTPATASLTLAVNLFSWNSWVALKSADATVAQGEANYLAAQQSLVQRVSAQYFAVLAAHDTLSAQQIALQSVQLQLDQAEQRFNVGVVAITDVEIARASRDSTNAAVLKRLDALDALVKEVQKAVEELNKASRDKK